MEKLLAIAGLVSVVTYILGYWRGRTEMAQELGDEATKLRDAILEAEQE